MRRRRKRNGGFMLLGAFLMFASASHQSGAISGTVTDGDGAPIPGVLVTATSDSGQHSTYVDIEGRYELSGLAQGAYALRAEVEGFCTATRRNVQAVGDGAATANFLLGLGPTDNPRGPGTLREAYRQADAVVRLRVTESTDAELLRRLAQSGGFVGIEHRADVIETLKADPVYGPRRENMRFVQYPAGHWSDATTTACGNEAPYAAGDEYVALLEWSPGFGIFTSIGPDYIFPVRDGQVPSSRSIDLAELGDGMSVGAFLDVLRALPQDTPTRPIEDPEAYAVYASLIPTEWPVTVANATRLVFREEASREFRCAPTGRPMETDWLPVVQDFLAAHDEQRTLLAGQDLGMPYVVVPIEDIRAILRSRPDPMSFGWSNFRERFPNSGGYMFVSAVGFDTAKERAIVQMGHFCGNLCGGSEVHMLEKVGGVWRKARIPGVLQCVIMI